MTCIAPLLCLWLRRIVVGACLIISPLAFADPAIDWLASQQQADGSFSHSPSSLATPFQATAEVLLTLQAMDLTTHSAYRPAVDYITANSDANTEYLARKIQILAADGQDVTVLIADLVNRQNPDGGFADQPGYGSSVLTTGFAIAVLYQAQVPVADAITHAIQYLLSSQNEDGTWGDHFQASPMYLTAHTVMALTPYKLTEHGVSNAVASATSYLSSQADFAGQWSEVHSTALILQALLDNTSDGAAYDFNIEDLRSIQSPDNSWLMDSYSTALAVRVIYRINSSIPSS